MNSNESFLRLDRESSEIEKAREAATRARVSNARFEAGSIYELPFPGGSFDVVFAHAVFEHLSEPAAVLAEIHRVLRHDGLVALRSPDWGGFLIAPSSEQLDAAIAHYQQMQIQSEGEVHVGRKFKALLRAAGFRDLEFSASYECYRSLESIGEYLAQRIERSADNGASEEEGKRVQGLASALREWQRCEDGIFAQSWCEILGRK